VQRLAADRALTRRMGAAARARARGFTWDAATERYLGMFSELAPAVALDSTVATP
jgi:glycosyltransferase involved in cell wall biosynthesis